MMYRKMHIKFPNKAGCFGGLFRRIMLDMSSSTLVLYVQQMQGYYNMLSKQSYFQVSKGLYSQKSAFLRQHFQLLSQKILVNITKFQLFCLIVISPSMTHLKEKKIDVSQDVVQFFEVKCKFVHSAVPCYSAVHTPVSKHIAFTPVGSHKSYILSLGQNYALWNSYISQFPL